MSGAGANPTGAARLGVGHIKTRTHDYIRHGTVTLFAALSYLDGKILSRTAEQHTHKEWLAFLKVIERETPAGLQIHLIIDNYATHKHPAVKAWLARHSRFHLHFTPTGSSWLNLVERFFRDLTEDVVREGSFGSVPELVRAMETYPDGAESGAKTVRVAEARRGDSGQDFKARAAKPPRRSYDPLFIEHYTRTGSLIMKLNIQQSKQNGGRQRWTT